MKEKLLVLVLTLCWSYHAAGQPPDGGRVRISVISGGSAPFVFNSMNDYQNGKTLTQWTKFGITLQDTGVGVDFPYRWELRFIALSGNIASDGPAPNLPLNTIELSATIQPGFGFGGGCGGAWGVDCFGPLPLTNAFEQMLARDLSVPGVGEEPVSPTDQIFITYTCGINPCPCPPGNNLLGTPSDYYTVDIDFNLEGFLP